MIGSGQYRHPGKNKVEIPDSCLYSKNLASKNMNIFTDEKVAKEYDAYYSSALGEQIDRLERQAIQELLKSIKPGKMLEIGCGTGHWTSFSTKWDLR